MRSATASLRFFFQFVCERPWKLWDLVRSPSAKTLPAVLTREQVARLIGAVREDRFKVVLTLIYGCGLRLGEALALEVRDIPKGQRRIHIRGGKGLKDRFVPLPEGLRRMLQQWWLQHRHPRLLFPGVGRGWREHRRFPSGPANAGRNDQTMSEGSVQLCVRVARAERVDRQRPFEAELAEPPLGQAFAGVEHGRERHEAGPGSRERATGHAPLDAADDRVVARERLGDALLHERRDCTRAALNLNNEVVNLIAELLKNCLVGISGLLCTLNAAVEFLQRDRRFVAVGRNVLERLLAGRAEAFERRNRPFRALKGDADGDRAVSCY